MKSNSTFNNIEDLNNQKEWLYYFRDWIAEYRNKIFSKSKSLYLTKIYTFGGLF
jgi:hypothetical protein